ncbi:MAG TPA: ankyrin repeat domain-containing protein [Candidatus Rifleibacterium sp.]|nr:ankyrin repeat domain-containing protein [Candidatus Rifleibacterium sp.]HPT47735.1 ankyrin repeat domain-containing protein [Candidatus Rifleibacterium sp.]
MGSTLIKARNLLVLVVIVTLCGCGTGSAPTREQWNTLVFWKTATLAEVRGGLKAGYDVDMAFDNGHTPLMMAAFFNPSVEVIEELLNASASLGISAAGLSPLMAAVSQNSNVEITRLLIKRGSDVNARGINGLTPILQAAYSCPKEEIFMMLVDAGADLSARLDDGKTVRELAEKNRKIGVKICNFLDGNTKPEATGW